jgi:hypothetical protein
MPRALGISSLLCSSTRRSFSPSSRGTERRYEIIDFLDAAIEIASASVVDAGCDNALERGIAKQ